jgi:threonine dehydrogenase-like Zn-dependent dehydrogenase
VLRHAFLWITDPWTKPWLTLPLCLFPRVPLSSVSWTIFVQYFKSEGGANVTVSCGFLFPCYSMSETMTYQDGALIEPLAVAVHSVSRTPVTQGSNALVFGAGPIGLLVAATVYAKGANQVTIFDINEHRLAFAKEYLPQIQTVQLPLPPKDTPDLLAWSQELIEKMVQSGTFDRELIDVCYECTGVDTCIQMAMFSARRGGVVMLIGLGKGSALLPTEVMSVREVDVRGNFRYCHAYPEAIQLVSQGKVPLNGLVTHQFKLADTLEAFETVMKGGAGVVKVQIGDF